MRPQQQNRRMRGRNNGGGGNNNNNNNRKGPNPLTRNYESNGPDVKIRGSAQQIAEKYTALARDAMSSGDRVIAENYLQHAEHYNRIIAAAQAQFAAQQIQTVRDDLDDDMDDAGIGFEGPVNGNDMQPQPQMSQPQPEQPAIGSGPQPEIDGLPAEVALNGETNGQPYQGRNRERRHHGSANGNGTGAAEGQPSGESEARPAEGEEGFQPRRGRRPRRGERSRERQAEGGSDGGQRDDVPAPAGEPALSAVED